MPQSLKWKKIKFGYSTEISSSCWLRYSQKTHPNISWKEALPSPYSMQMCCREHIWTPLFPCFRVKLWNLNFILRKQWESFNPEGVSSVEIGLILAFCCAWPISIVFIDTSQPIIWKLHHPESWVKWTCLLWWRKHTIRPLIASNQFSLWFHHITKKGV